VRRLVVDDPGLRDRLRSVTDHPAFIAEVIAVGSEHGLPVSAADVEDGLRAARLQRLERWL